MTDRRRFLRQAFVGGLTPLVPQLGRAASTSAPAVSRVWPSDQTLGDPQAQTSELASFLRQGFNVQVRAGEHVVVDTIVCRTASPTLSGVAGARLVFTSAASGGLRFVGCNAPGISALELVWPGSDRPARSHFGAGVLFARCASPQVIDLQVSRAPGAGVHFDQCDGARVSRLTVRDTGADGLHFANCTDSAAIDVDCERTGDDGVAVVDYRHKPKGGGFRLERLVVRDSYSRGIALVGATAGVVDEFTVDGCASNGIHVEQDGHYDSHVPANVSLSNGTVTGAGRVSPRVGNQFGANILRAQGVMLRDVTLRDSARIGCFVADSVGVVLMRVSVERAAGVGALLQGATVRLIDFSVRGAGRQALLGRRCDEIGVERALIDLRGSEWTGEHVVFRENRSLDIVDLDFLAGDSLPGGRALFLRGAQTGTATIGGLPQGAILNDSAVSLSVTGQ